METIKQLTAIIPVGPMVGQLNNLRETLKKCRDLPIQVVVACDDHGDGTREELVDLLKIESSSALLLTDAYSGPGPARNAGLVAVNSKWIVFWDADDCPDPQETLQIIAQQQDVEVNLICNQYSIIDSVTMHQIYSSKIRKDEVVNLQAVGTQPGLWRFIFARELISGLQFTDSKMGEDQEFLAQAMAKNPKISFTKNSSYQYLVSRAGQLTGDKSNIFHLIGIVERMDASYLDAPAKFRECIRLMLNQMILSMLKSQDRKARLVACKYLLARPSSFLRSFSIILREKRIRHG